MQGCTLSNFLEIRAKGTFILLEGGGSEPLSEEVIAAINSNITGPLSIMQVTLYGSNSNHN